jgi:hypothetical protein
MADKNDTAALMAFARKHKLALGIGAGVLLVLAASNGSQTGATGSGSGGRQGPVADGGFDSSGGSGGVDSSGGTGAPDGFDKRKWDEDQRRGEGEQRNRIDTIREVERCQLADGSVVEVPAGSCNS